MEAPIDINELPADVPVVNIVVSQADQDMLEAAPYRAQDVLGSFVDTAGKTYSSVQINYRGAYALNNLISAGSRRNWKVKFSKLDRYEDRREWNFNYEPHLRQKLAYDLMRFAGVRCAKPRHVLLEVNGEPQGLYLQYEDLDNTNWLKENFSDADGDLYKAGYDLPDDIPGRRFAELTYLGPENDNYFLSYNKKKSRTGVAKKDNSTIRDFTEALSSVAFDDTPEFYEANVTIDKLMSYLVVASFISHWDAYPYRPKNYWLYQNPDDQRWSMLPWDMDGAFREHVLGIDNWGIEASLFFQYDQYDAYSHLDDEGKERPFVRLLMKHQVYRDAYIARYRELMDTLFKEEFLLTRIDALEDLIAPNASDGDRGGLESSNDELRQFIRDRRANVVTQLDSY